jgi:putative ABC transport system substrate-binding protein
VFAGVGGDPVRIGLINSLARPGGNLTGMLNVAIDIAGKRLQLLKELLPGIARAGVLRNAGNEASIAIVDELVKNGSAVGIEVVPVDFQRPEELRNAVEEAELRGAQALILTGDCDTRRQSKDGNRLVKFEEIADLLQLSV